MPVYPAENGYAIKGIAPPDLRTRDEATRLLYWSWVVELGLRAKDKELSQGLNKDGKPLRRITEATRKHRRSAMTPSGKGDPSAPPLMPARALSRTRSLLSGRAYPDRAEFWWRFDPFTGASWADTLEVQRDRWGRDVFGVSPKAQRLIQARSYELWDRWKRGLPVAAVRGAIIPMAPAVQRPPPPKEEVGNEAWRRLFAEPAKAAQPGRPGAPGNVLLTHIFGAEGPAKAGVGAIKVTPPKVSPPKVTRVAMAPPKAPAPPKPKPATPRPAWEWGTPIEPDRPIAERIRLSPAWERAGKMAEIGVDLEAKRDRVRKLDARASEILSRAGKLAGPDDPARATLAAELDRVKAELKVARVEREQAKLATAGQLKAILAPPPGARAFDWSHDVRLDTLSSREAQAAADRFMGGLAAAGPGHDRAVITWQTIPTGQQQRAHANSADRTISLKQAEIDQTAIHEWGHHVEYSVPGVHAATQEFLRHRVKGEASRPMKDLIPNGSYDAHEMGREDDFRKAFGDHAPYVGKEYPGGWTEVVSMGLEQLYVDPHVFAHKDREYVAFILGTLDGSLRKP